MICLLALLAALTASAMASAAKRAPSREQPHVVLESRSINTNEASQFHDDARFKPLAADVVRHEYIVQLKLPIDQSKALIEAELGVKFGNYMPHNSFMLYATDDVAHALRKHGLVLWIGAWLPEYKISSALFEADVHEQLQHDLYRFVVHYAGAVDSNAVVESFQRRLAEQTPAGVDIVKFEAIPTSTNKFYVEFAAHGNDHALRVAAYLAMQPEVHFIEPLGPIQYHNLEIAKIDLFDSTGTVPITSQISGNGIMLGVMDQGINSASCQLANKVVNAGGAADPHGTAIAAVAAGVAGVANGAKIFFIAQQNSALLSGLSAKLQAASEKSAFTILSAGSATAMGYNAAAVELDEYSSNYDRTLFVVSAGNTPKQLSANGYSKNALVVGSTAVGPSRHIIGASSPRVGTADFRFKPDVVSSGDGVYVSGCEMIQLNEGTSMAAATAAGAALLVRQYYLDGWYGTGSITADSNNIGFTPRAALVNATLIHGTTPASAAKDPAGGGAGAGGSPSNVQGFGRIELANALWFNQTSKFARMTISDDNELEQNGAFRVCFDVTKLGGKLRATVAWTDRAADVAAGHTLVNDIDLVVFSQANGQEWRGNDAVGFDHSNNVEQVDFMPPAVGQYVVVVSGTNLRDKQKFGFVMTGDYIEKACVDQQLDSQGNFVPSYPFPNCPGGCAEYDNDCQNGICVCKSAQAVGVDCSLVTCGASDACGQFGECDYAVGACRCVQGRRGDKCAFAYTSQPPEEIFTTRSTDSFRGNSVGTFVGLFIFLYILGCICSAVFGVVCGTKYLEYKRDSASDN